MSGWEIGFGIVGALGFCLALFLMLLEWHRYRLPLRLRVRETILVDSSKDAHLVLLFLTFVNPSPVGKTAYSILAGAPTKKDISVSPYQYLEDLEKVMVRLPNAEKARGIPASELLLMPLDIPPHQSQGKWLPVIIRAESSKNVTPLVHLSLIVKDVLDKTIAQYHGEIELKTQLVS